MTPNAGRPGRRARWAGISLARAKTPLYVRRRLARLREFCIYIRRFLDPSFVRGMAFEMMLDPLPSGDGVSLVPQEWREVTNRVWTTQLQLGMDFTLTMGMEWFELVSKDPHGMRLYRCGDRSLLVRPVPRNTVLLNVRASYLEVVDVVRRSCCHNECRKGCCLNFFCLYRQAPSGSRLRT